MSCELAALPFKAHDNYRSIDFEKNFLIIKLIIILHESIMCVQNVIFFSAIYKCHCSANPQVFSLSFYVEVVIKYEAPFFKYGIYSF